MPSLLIKIARCPEMTRSLESPAPNHPCSTVVTAQGRSRADYHLPEPWSGQIETAPILFVGSNPSFNPAEHFPNAAWSNKEIERFFTTRFEHSDQSSHYWRTVRNIAMDILGRPAVPGTDYALTEIVRCKSVGEQGVDEAMGACSSRYLAPTLQRACAPLVPEFRS